MSEATILPNESSIEKTFTDHLEKFFLMQDKKNALYSFQKQAWERFLKIGFPDKTNEQFRSVRLRDLYAKIYQLPFANTISKESIRQWILPETQDACLVFINGCFSEEHSFLSGLPKGIIVSSLSKAFQSYGTFFLNRLASLTQEKNPFILLNTALQQDGLFVYIQPKTICERPIQILHLLDSQDSLHVNPRFHLFAGKQSKSQWIFRQAHANLKPQSPYWINQYFDLALEEAAQVSWSQLSLHSEELGWNLGSLHASLKKNAILNMVSASNGTRTYRQDVYVELREENAQASFHGLALLNGGQQGHLHMTMEHQAPHCHSLQHFKTILNQCARSNFEGKIFVHQAAQKTQAYQLNNNLILSEDATAHSKPNLEIFADDVKASHGATFGQLNEEALFYLKSRGISETEARQMLIYSFGREIIERYPYPSLQSEWTAFFQNFISGQYEKNQL